MASAQPAPHGKFNMDQLLKQLECPVCFEYCTAPIVQCLNGHNLCSKCRSRLTLCPLCRAKISIVRNMFAEQMSEVEYPCSNNDKGCGEKIMLKDMEIHLKGCIFGMPRCLLQLPHMTADNRVSFIACDWRGKPFDLLAHVVKTHPGSLSNDPTTEVSYKLRKKHVLLVAAHNQLFWSLLNYNFLQYDLRGAVFPVTPVKPPNVYKFQYEFQSSDGLLCITKRGNICNQGCSDEKYNSTIFQGHRMGEQLLNDNKLSFKIKIIKEAGPK